MSDAQRELAYHEAGHAVAYIYFGRLGEGASIVEDDATYGRAMYSGYWHSELNRREERTILRQAIVAAYAGQEAEKRLNPVRADPVADEVHWDEDNTEAFRLLCNYPPRRCDYIGDDVFQAGLDRLRGDARRLVARLWPQIERVAEVLLVRRELTAEEIGALVEVAP